MNLPPFELEQVTTVDEAIAAVQAADDGHIIAGGTVLVPMMKHQLLRPATLVDITRVDELAGVGVDGDVRLGPLATHAELSRDTTLARHAPLLATACGRVASPTIRSMGTIGGNVCYGESASDPPPALLALGARVELRGPEGSRTVELRDFYHGFYETDREPDELLTKIHVPVQPQDADWTYFKWTPRAQEDKPLLGLAVLIRRDGNDCHEARLAISGIDETPRLLAATGDHLTGESLDEARITAAAEVAATEVDPIDDLQGTSDYRRDMVRVWVRRVLLEMVRTR